MIKCKIKRIVIDARMYGLEHAGIGRYVMNLIREIKNQKSKINNLEITLIIRRGKAEEIRKEHGNRFRLVPCDAPHYSFKEQILLPVLLLQLKPDLVHFPHFNIPIFRWGKYVVTIHDLIKHQSRGIKTTTRRRLFYWFKYLNYRLLVHLAVKRAVKILVPSNWWKQELVERYGLAKDKVVVTYEGVDKKFKVQKSRFKVGEQREKILTRYAIKKPFVIYTGSLYPHKNIESLVSAMKAINFRPSNYHTGLHGGYLKLVVACSRGVFYDRFKKKIKEMKAEKLVNLLGFVPDEELAVLYRQAEAFVFPSLLEGFGLPGLEAMACGCPVVASNIPVLKEIYGKAALYFDPLDIDDMAEKILKAIRNTSTCNTLIEKGYQQVKKYSWQKMAKETIGVYKDILYARGGEDDYSDSA